WVKKFRFQWLEPDTCEAEATFFSRLILVAVAPVDLTLIFSTLQRCPRLTSLTPVQVPFTTAQLATLLRSLPRLGELTLFNSSCPRCASSPRMRSLRCKPLECGFSVLCRCALNSSLCLFVLPLTDPS